MSECGVCFEFVFSVCMISSLSLLLLVGGQEWVCLDAYSCNDVNAAIGIIRENFECGGLSSCGDYRSTISGTWVVCSGAQSCQGVIDLGLIPTEGIECSGDRSCVESGMFQVEFSDDDAANGEGYLSMSGNAKILDIKRINCYGSKSCENATIICNNVEECQINCFGGNSCNGLKISSSKVVFDDKGNIFSKHNRTGFDEFWISEYAFLDDNNMYPNPEIYSKATRYQNRYFCDPSHLQFTINCVNDDSKCSHSNVTQLHEARALCCSGDSSCFKSTIKHNSSIILGINDYITDGNIAVIRCDGANSCQNSKIYNGRISGNIYITGLEAGKYSVIEAKWGNIIISSKMGGYLSNIISGNNLFITGSKGLFLSNIDIINNNVYYLSYMGGFGAKHNIIGGVLYCLAYKSCNLITVNDVQNVVCEGKNSCEGGKFNSIRSSLFAMGDDSLNSAIIIANNGWKMSANAHENYFILSVDGDMSQNYSLICKSNMFCFVMCRTVNSCTNLIVTLEDTNSFVLFSCAVGVNCNHGQTIYADSAIPGSGIVFVVVFFLF